MKRLLLFIAALCVLIAAGAPAALLDRALDAASGGRLRLADARGTLWDGHGRLAAAGDGAAHAWAKLAWQWEAGLLLHGRLGWALRVDSQPAAGLSLGAGGWALTDAAFELPAGAVLATLAHPLARAGWHGRLRAHGPGLHCDWRARCEGSLELGWQGARVDLFPTQPLGDYLFRLRFAPDALSAQLSGAAANPLRADGTLALARGKPRVELRLDGDGALLTQLPAILHGLARADPGGGLRIDWPRR